MQNQRDVYLKRLKLIVFTFMFMNLMKSVDYVALFIKSSYFKQLVQNNAMKRTEIIYFLL